MEFDKNYFTSLNYTNYLEREIRYRKMAQELYVYLKDKGILRPNTFILDYGCAIGFLVNGFRKMGANCDGYDISEWAKEEARKRGIEFVLPTSNKYDIMMAFDVFEHMTDNDICQSLRLINPKYLLVRIPCSVDGKNFLLDVSRRDPTHINCKPKNKWVELICNNGFEGFESIDLYTVYDTDGVMCYLFYK